MTIEPHSKLPYSEWTLSSRYHRGPQRGGVVAISPRYRYPLHSLEENVEHTGLWATGHDYARAAPGDGPGDGPVS
eukprot:gene25707-11365_t